MVNSNGNCPGGCDDTANQIAGGRISVKNDFKSNTKSNESTSGSKSQQLPESKTKVKVVQGGRKVN